MRFHARRLSTSLAVLSLFAMGACVVDQDEVVSDTTSTSTPAEGMSITGTVDEGSWPVGPLYHATSLHAEGEAVAAQPGSVRLRRSAHDSLSIDAGGCAVGSGTFALDGTTVTNVSLGRLLAPCTPDEPDVFHLVSDLIYDEPELAVDGPSLMLASENIRLEMMTDDREANNPVIPTGVRFVGRETTLAGVDATAVSLVAHTYFAATVELPGCEVMVSLGGAGIDDVAPRDVISRVDDRFCEPPAEAAPILDFLRAEPAVEADAAGIRLQTSTDTFDLASAGSTREGF